MGSVTHGTLVLTFSRILFMISGMLIHLGLARLFEKNIYGYFGILLGLLNIGQTLVMSGSQFSVARFVAQFPERTGSIIKSGLTVQLFIAVPASCIGILEAVPIAALLKAPELAPEVRLISGLLPIYALYIVYLGGLNGKAAYGQQATVVVFMSVARLILILGLAWIGFKLKGVLIGYALPVLITAFLARFFLKDNLTKAVRRHESPVDIRRILLFLLPMMTFSVLTALYTQLDIFLVKFFLNDLILTAEYTASSFLGKQTYFITLSLGVALFPKITSVYFSESRPEASKYIEHSLRYLILCLGLAATMYFVGGKLMVRILYPDTFTEASGPLPYIAVGYSLFAVFSLICTILNSISHLRSSIIGILIHLLSLFVASTLLLPRFGLFGAAMADILAPSAGLLWIGWRMKKAFGVTIPLTPLIISILAVGLTTGFCTWIAHSMDSLWMGTVTAPLAYCSIILFTGQLNFEDLKGILYSFKS